MVCNSFTKDNIMMFRRTSFHTKYILISSIQISSQHDAVVTVENANQLTDLFDKSY